MSNESIPSKIEKFPQGHILNQEILETIALLESCNDDGTLNKERYALYIEEQKQLRPSSVLENQRRAIEGLKEGKSLPEISFDVIYGIGGFNRYVIGKNGKVTLISSSIERNESRKKILINKAKELGLEIW